MRYPTNKFLILLLLPMAAAIAIPFVQYWPDLPLSSEQIDMLLPGLLVIDGLLLLLFLIDSFTVPRKKRFQARREHEKVFSIHYPHHVTLIIDVTRGLQRNIRSRLYDDAHSGMEFLRFPHDMSLRIGRNIIQYRLRVNRRGRYELQHVYITVYSLLGLARRVYKIRCESRMHVYPDLKAVSKYALLARKSHLGLMGIRRTQRGGGDNEFERLREYQRDDNFRHIDWKTTARQNRLIVRTYQMSQNQTVFFLLDCGRMMTAEFHGRSLLDYSLNSVLLLAHVALKQGDRVGLMAFAGNVIRYVKPAPGPAQHRRLVQAAYDVRASHEESNFDRAFHYLNTVSRKRSLVCLVTNVIDDMNAGLMQSYLGAISGRHLPFAVLLKQREIQEIVDSRAGDTRQLFTQAAAADFLLWKEGVMERLRNRGVLALEAFPDEMDASLINEYLRIKARKLL
ncbi:MAG: DUF58 domain-containing protein [Leptospiraceae bacterium]|nr:DUF58 domain-containing protein [Leptospiraceae bacterium]MCB1320989.1 DUF58 domain-containing protein [Leptospiraceae bacterium]